MSLRKIAILLMLCMLGVTTYAQKVTYIKKNASLVEFFKEIRSQTSYHVIWNEKEFNVNQRFDADFKDAELKGVMTKISGKLNFSYTYVGKMILLKAKIVSPKAIETDTLVKPELENLAREFNLHQVDIVSTGYQFIPKDRATGSFSLVDSVQFKRRVTEDVFSRLEGISHTLLFNKNTARASNGGTDLSIRGLSTLYANSQPLIVLDNFPYNGDLNSINPGDVSTISILKDAAAASIWGIRAGNGVVVITTKKGRYRQPLEISFNSNVSVSAKPDLYYSPQYLSSKGYIEMEIFLFNNGKYATALANPATMPVSEVVKLLDQQKKGASPVLIQQELDRLRGNDFRDDLSKYVYRNGVSQRYFLNLSKGTDISNHYFSGGYDHSTKSILHNNSNRITLNTQHDIRVFKKMVLSGGVYYTKTNSDVDSLSGGLLTSQVPSYGKLKDVNGQNVIFYKGITSLTNSNMISKGFLDGSYNALGEFGSAPTVISLSDLRLNTNLNYSILPGLNVQLKYQYEHIRRSREIINSIENYFTRSQINRYAQLSNGKVSAFPIPIGSIQDLLQAEITSQNFRAQLNYDNRWQQHEISAIAGYELSEYDSQANDYTHYNYNSKTGTYADIDALTTFNLNPSGTGSIPGNKDRFGNLDRIRSVFANAAYTYKQKYVLSGSARIDGANYLGVNTNNKRVPLWSVGALWHLDREKFLALNWLEELKIRTTYGFNGNFEKANTGITTLIYSSVSEISKLNQAVVNHVGNPDLRWEKIGIANLGIDFSLMKRRVSGSIEYFVKSGKDLLGDKLLPRNTGLITMRMNYAEMKSHGLDLSLTIRNLDRQIKWQSTFLFSKVKDRLTRYDQFSGFQDQFIQQGALNLVVERPIYSLYAYKWAGLDPLTGEPRGYLNGEVSKDYKSITSTLDVASLEYVGPTRPVAFGAVSSAIGVGPFTLSFNISYKLGYYFRRYSVNYTRLYQNLTLESSGDFEKRWQKPGDELWTSIPSMPKYGEEAAVSSFYNASAVLATKGDHIRLQDMSLSFDINSRKWKSIPAKQIQLYVYASNLGILWRANDYGLDPDILRSSYVLDIPTPRSFSLGLKANF